MNIKTYKYKGCKGARRQKRNLNIRLFIILLLASFLVYGAAFLCRGYNELLMAVEYEPMCYDLVVETPKLVNAGSFPLREQTSVKEKIKDIANSHNFKWPDYLIRLAWCESRFDPNAVGDNGHSRGLFQIHNLYHPEVSDMCAFDIECATKWTMWRINSGYQHEWTCDRYI